ncbi:MAG TPA: GDSL-type esterase/lipase family protein [Sphingorhabdus sp.]|nr:GDSL-type esterase/lipase family protein [Sphingorhabdus sp.]
MRTCPTRTKDADTPGQVQTELLALFRQVKAKAPMARIIVVDYLAVAPQHGRCAALGLSKDETRRGRAVASALASRIRSAARTAGIELVPVSRLLRKGHVCASTPLVSGWYDDDGKRHAVPFHPNAAGMDAVAEALAKVVVRSSFAPRP